MKTQNPIWTGLLFVALLTFTCCEDDKPCQDPSLPECENYDPCLDERVVDAEFEMSYYINGWISEEFWNFDYASKGAEGLRMLWGANHTSEYDYLFEDWPDAGWIPSDTVTLRLFAGGATMRCEATHPNAESYSWRVGLEGQDRMGQAINVAFTGPDFNGLEIPPPVDVRLKVAGSPFVDCPDSDSIAEEVRPIVFVEEDESLLVGRWQGVSTQYPGETRVLEIRKRLFFSDSVYVLTGLLEFLEDCEPSHDGGEHGFRLGSLGYRHARGRGSIPSTSCYHTVNGSPSSIVMRLLPNGTLRIIYSEHIDGAPLTLDDDEVAYFSFEGRRIP